MFRIQKPVLKLTYSGNAVTYIVNNEVMEKTDIKSEVIQKCNVH